MQTKEVKEEELKQLEKKLQQCIHFIYHFMHHVKESEMVFDVSIKDLEQILTVKLENKFKLAKANMLKDNK